MGPVICTLVLVMWFSADHCRQLLIVDQPTLANLLSVALMTRALRVVSEREGEW